MSSRGVESDGLEIGTWLPADAKIGGGLSGRGGGSTGPSQPSCRPRMYSFQVCLPMTRSPWTPSHSLIPVLWRNSATMFSFSSAAGSSCDTSPLLFRSFRIFSAKPARTSPSRRPSTTSQSKAAATSIGLTYSWKNSREGRRPSPGGAERKIVILRGIWDTGRESLAM